MDGDEVEHWVEGSHFPHWKNQPVLILTEHCLFWVKKGWHKRWRECFPRSDLKSANYVQGTIRGELVVTVLDDRRGPIRAQIGRGGRMEAALIADNLNRDIREREKTPPRPPLDGRRYTGDYIDGEDSDVWIKRHPVWAGVIVVAAIVFVLSLTVGGSGDKSCQALVDALNRETAQVNSIVNDPQARAIAEAEYQIKRVSVNAECGPLDDK